MHIKCGIAPFKKAYFTASIASPTKSTNTYLTNVKMNVSSDGTCVLQASNLEYYIEAKLTGESASPGATLLPNKSFGDFLKLTKSDLEFESDGRSVRVTSGGSKLVLPTADPSIFVGFPSIDDKERATLSVTVGDLSAMIRSTAHIDDTEKENSASPPCRIIWDEEFITMFSFGNDCAAVRSQGVVIDGPKECPSYPILIHYDSLKAIHRIISRYDKNEECKLRFTDNMIFLDVEDVAFSASLLHAKSRNIGMRPSDFGEPLVVPRVEFLEAVMKTAVAFGLDGYAESRAIDVDIRDGKARVKTTKGEAAESCFEIGYDSDPISFTVRSDFIQGALSRLDSDAVDLGAKAKVPGICIASGSTYYMMPLMAKD